VQRAADLAKAAGARRAVLLPVSAPFHCPLMKPAQDQLKAVANGGAVVDSITGSITGDLDDPLTVTTAGRLTTTRVTSGLQSLYAKYKDKGLVIVGVPANNFGGQEPGKHLVTYQRFQVDDLAGGKQVRGLDGEVGVGEHEIRADRTAPAEQLGEQDDRDGGAPDLASARHDEQVEVAIPFEVQVGDAAGERDQADPRERAQRN